MGTCFTGVGAGVGAGEDVDQLMQMWSIESACEVYIPMKKPRGLLRK